MIKIWAKAKVGSFVQQSLHGFKEAPFELVRVGSCWSFGWGFDWGFGWGFGEDSIATAVATLRVFTSIEFQIPIDLEKLNYY
jgi:hypothetical protein